MSNFKKIISKGLFCVTLSSVLFCRATKALVSRYLIKTTMFAGKYGSMSQSKLSLASLSGTMLNLSQSFRIVYHLIEYTSQLTESLKNNVFCVSFYYRKESTS